MLAACMVPATCCSAKELKQENCVILYMQAVAEQSRDVQESTRLEQHVGRVPVVPHSQTSTKYQHVVWDVQVMCCHHTACRKAKQHPFLQENNSSNRLECFTVFHCDGILELVTVG